MSQLSDIVFDDEIMNESCGERINNSDHYSDMLNDSLHIDDNMSINVTPTSERQPPSALKRRITPPTYAHNVIASPLYQLEAGCSNNQMFIAVENGNNIINMYVRSTPKRSITTPVIAASQQCKREKSRKLQTLRKQLFSTLPLHPLYNTRFNPPTPMDVDQQYSTPTLFVNNNEPVAAIKDDRTYSDICLSNWASTHSGGYIKTPTTNNQSSRHSSSSGLSLNAALVEINKSSIGSGGSSYTGDSNVSTQTEFPNDVATQTIGESIMARPIATINRACSPLIQASTSVNVIRPQATASVRSAVSSLINRTSSPLAQHNMTQPQHSPASRSAVSANLPASSPADISVGQQSPNASQNNGDVICMTPSIPSDVLRPNVTWDMYYNVQPPRYGFRINWRGYRRTALHQHIWTLFLRQYDILLTCFGSEKWFIHDLPNSWAYFPHTRYHLVYDVKKLRVIAKAVSTLEPVERMIAFASMSLEDQKALKSPPYP